MLEKQTMSSLHETISKSTWKAYK